MNRISRSFLCHLLPAMNIQFVWNNNKNNRDLEKLNSNIMQTQTIKDTINEFNPESDYRDTTFPIETQLHFSSIPNYGDYPQRFPVTAHNIFEQKFPNDMETNGFEDFNHFDFSDQMEEPIFDSSETYRLIESPLIIDNNIKVNHSSSDRPYYFEDFSSNHKNNRYIKTNNFRSNHFDSNYNQNEKNQWKPINKINENLSDRKRVKTNDREQKISQVLAQPTQKPLPQYSSVNLTYHTTSTTIAPTITTPLYSMRKYLGKNPQTVSFRDFRNNSEKLTKKEPKTPKISKNHLKVRDWSLKVSNNSNLWFPSQNLKSIFMDKPKNETIVRKLHSNYTKSSVIYSIEDSFDERIRKNKSNVKKKLNKIEIKSIPQNVRNDINFYLRGIPGIDYPTHSSSASSNFTCNDPGFYADIQFGCQVYHHCEEHNYHQKFICPNGTLFNIQIQSCDYWFNVECDHKQDLTTDSNENISLSSQIETNVKTGNNSSEGNLSDDNSSEDKPTDPQIIEELKIFVKSVSNNK